MCEMYARMKMIGLVHGNTFDLPLTQEELADATGLTPVHTNRVLQRMRGEGLIELSHKVLTIPDVKALEEAANFDPNYLHIERQPRSLALCR